MENSYKIAFDNVTKRFIESGGYYMVGSMHTYARIYVLLYGEVPHIMTLETDGLYRNHNSDELRYVIEDDYVEEVAPGKPYTFDRVLKHRTLDAFATYFESLGGYVIHCERYPIIVYDHFMAFYDDDLCNIVILTNTPLLDKTLIDLVADEKDQDDKYCYCQYVTHSDNGFSRTALKIGTWEDTVDLDSNYNDDLPDKQIKDFLKSNQSGLVLLHGIPGSGKTYYIRHLMKTIKGRTFMLLDPNTFSYIMDSSFIDLLLDAKNSVIILEDCENMLVDRTIGKSELNALLNLSDGILGDSFNFKFICTFNANIAKLDKAILRKGRLKVNYEFKELTVEKTKSLIKKLGKSADIETIDKGMALTDIYNFEEDNGTKASQPIGFKK